MASSVRRTLRSVPSVSELKKGSTVFRKKLMQSWVFNKQGYGFHHCGSHVILSLYLEPVVSRINVEGLNFTPPQTRFYS